MDAQIDSNKLVWPGLAGLYAAGAPYSFALVRFIAGAIVVYHGYAKLFHGFAPVVAAKIVGPMGFPAPLAWTYFIALLECFGGIALALGLLTRPLALLFAIEFVFITIYSIPHGYFFTAPGGGWEFPLLLLVLYVAIFFRGADKCAIDRMIGKEV
jgi:putative oxidoreductase